MSTEIHQGVLSVRWFAGVGSGDVSVDTAKIQAALDHPTSDAILFNSNGGTTIYTVTGLTVSRSKRIIIDRGVTVRLANLSNTSVFTLNANGITLEGEGAIDGNRSNQTAGHGISVPRRDDVRILGLTVSECVESGIYLADAQRAWVEEVKVSNTTETGIFLIAELEGSDLEDFRAINCYVDRSDAAGNNEKGIAVQRNSGVRNIVRPSVVGCHIKMHATPSGSNAFPVEFHAGNGVGGVSHGIISNCRTVGGQFGISIARTQHCSVTGNTVYNASGVGIEIADSIYGSATGNTIDGNGSTDSGVTVDGTNSDCIGTSVSGNTIKNTTSQGMHWFNGAPDSTCSGNVVNVAAGIGYRFQNTDGVRITGNTYQGNGTASYGLQVDNSSRLRFVNNQFRGSSGRPTDIFLANSNISDIYIDPSNDFQGATITPIFVFETGSGVASNVYVDDMAATIAQLTASVNDYHPTWQRRWRLSSDASRTITGIARGYDGRRLTIMNVGSNEIILSDQDAASVAANRIDTGSGASVSLLGGDCAELVYDGTSSLWRVVGTN